MTMTKSSLGLLLALASLAVLAAPSAGSAQEMKLDIKVFGGVSGTTFVEMLETGRVRSTYSGWQAGFGARVKKRKWFMEALLSFNRWAFSFSGDQLAGSDVITRLKGRTNSFELPINGGFVPYQNSYFKLFLYAGYVNHFNTKVLVQGTVVGGEKFDAKVKPKEVNLAIYQAIARFGMSFDLAMFNIDFNYSISMNSAGSDSYRTGYHQLQLNLAYLF